MRALVAALAVAILAPGCLSGTPPSPTPAGAEDPATPPAEPGTIEFRGRVFDSALDPFSHMRPEEDLIWPIQQEGFLLDVAQAPQAMEVALDWTGGGSFMIMLHSHKAEGTNTYVEHVTEMSPEKPQCLRVPTEDLTTGHWQVMIHTEGSRGADFVLTVSHWGGEASIVEDERHGHWRQDGAFDVEEHEGLPCAGAL